MLIQEGLSKLKIIRKKMDGLLSDIQKYSAWNNKIKCPLGIFGKNQEYSISVAEKELKSRIQSYKDLQNEFLKIKVSIDKTNLSTMIMVAGKEMSLHEAILYKRDVLGMSNALIRAYDFSSVAAQNDVKKYNSNESITEKADVVYLFPQTELDKSRAFIDEFIEEVDGQMQIANATTHLLDIE